MRTGDRRSSERSRLLVGNEGNAGGLCRRFRLLAGIAQYSCRSVGAGRRFDKYIQILYNPSESGLKPIAAPADIRSDAGYKLDLVQRGEAPADFRPTPDVGSGVMEIRLHDDNECRVFYVATPESRPRPGQATLLPRHERTQNDEFTRYAERHFITKPDLAHTLTELRVLHGQAQQHFSRAWLRLPHPEPTRNGILRKGAEVMEVHFPPEVQAKLEQMARETGRRSDELVENVVTDFFDELTATRQTLDGRYDDLESGRVKPIPGNEVFARLRAKSAARRARHQ